MTYNISSIIGSSAAGTTSGDTTCCASISTSNNSWYGDCIFVSVGSFGGACVMYVDKSFDWLDKDDKLLCFVLLVALVVKVFSELILFNDELLDTGLDCNVEKVRLPLFGLPPLRSASFLYKSYSSFGSTGLWEKGVAVPLLVNDDILELV